LALSLQTESFILRGTFSCAVPAQAGMLQKVN